MTKHELYFFAFTILFFLIISFAHSKAERALYKWTIRLKLWRNYMVILMLLVLIGYLLEPNITQGVISFLVDVIIILFKALFAFVDSIINEANSSP